MSVLQEKSLLAAFRAMPDSERKMMLDLAFMTALATASKSDIPDLLNARDAGSAS